MPGAQVIGDTREGGLSTTAPAVREGPISSVLGPREGALPAPVSAWQHNYDEWVAAGGRKGDWLGFREHLRNTSGPDIDEIMEPYAEQMPNYNEWVAAGGHPRDWEGFRKHLLATGGPDWNEPETPEEGPIPGVLPLEGGLATGRGPGGYGTTASAVRAAMIAASQKAPAPVETERGPSLADKQIEDVARGFPCAHIGPSSALAVPLGER